jgi:hypothetical protein
MSKRYIPLDPILLVLGASAGAEPGLGALRLAVLPNCGVAAYGIPSAYPILLPIPDPGLGDIALRVGEYTCST